MFGSDAPRSASGDVDPSGSWIRQLGAGKDRAHLSAGELIFRAGQNRKIVVLWAGLVRTFMAPPSERQMTIRYARAGDLLGVAPCLAGSDDWNAEAITDVEMTVLTVDELRRAAVQNPELPWRVAEHMALWMTAAMHSLADDAGQPMTVRVARHLREMSLRAPDGRLVAHISRQRLADAVGTVREVISRELKVLRTSQVIDTAGRSVTVLDEGRLANIASGRVPAPGDGAAQT